MAGAGLSPPLPPRLISPLPCASFLGGVLPSSLSLVTFDLNLVSCRCFERRSYISMLVGVSSPLRSELSDPLCRGRDRILFSLDLLLLGIFSRGWRQGINASPSPRTCKDRTHKPQANQHLGTQRNEANKSAIVSNC